MTLKKALLSLLKILGITAFWLSLWLLVSFKVSNELLFPSPLATLKALLALSLTKSFWVTALSSLSRVFLGIIISFILGIALAIATENSKIIKSILSPSLSVIKATPVASFIILALLWLSRSILPAFVTALLVIPIVWSNVSEGIRSVDTNLKEVAKIYKFSLKDKLFKLYIPSVAPFFTAACKSSLGMAWKAGISAEVLSTPKNAIGTELYFSKTYFETPSLFAWTIVVVVLSILIEKLFVFSLQKLGNRFHITPRRTTAI